MRSVLEAAKLQGIFEFGGFRLDLNGPLLTRDGRALEVAPKALDILAVLAANAGRVVLKDDLLSLVWPDSVVEEGNLAVYISSLRKVLAENGEPGVWIETAPKRGYRFAAPVRRVPDIPGVVSSSGSEGLFRIAEHYMLQCTPEGCRRANDIFQGLIGKDPFDARARAGKAGSLLLRYFLGDLSVEQDRDAAAALLAEAGRIHPGCSHVRANLAHMNWFWNWQWQKAEDELQGAVELATDDMTRDYALMWHGSYLSRAGDIDRGIQELQQANSVRPLSPAIWSLLSYSHFLARDFTKSASVSKEALQLHPNCWYLYEALSNALTMLGEYRAALRYLRLATLLNPVPNRWLIGNKAYLYVLTGRTGQAATLLTRMQSRNGHHIPSISVAAAQAAMGDTDGALESIERACAARDLFVSSLGRDGRLDCLRTRPRFRRILAQTGASLAALLR